MWYLDVVVVIVVDVVVDVVVVDVEVLLLCCPTCSFSPCPFLVDLENELEPTLALACSWRVRERERILAMWHLNVVDVVVVVVDVVVVVGLLVQRHFFSLSLSLWWSSAASCQPLLS